MRFWIAFCILVHVLLAQEPDDGSITTISSDGTTVTGSSDDTTISEGTTVTGASDATEGTTVSGASDATTVSGASAASDETTVSEGSGESDATTISSEGNATTEDDGPHKDCYLCAPTVQCGETIEGDFSSADVNVLLMKEMEDDDYIIMKGEVFESAQKIFFDVFEGLTVGKAQVDSEKTPTLVQFQHFFDTNLTFSRSGLHGKEEWDSFRPATLPLAIRQKRPWTLMFKMHENLTGFETGDENGWFNNHIPWNGTATTQSFNVRGEWKTTSITFKCANSSIPIL